MGDPSQSTPSTVRPSQDRLNSWKEIAAYLNRDVTTVQRWEKREGMPVRRHLHDRIGSVYAFRTELDVWASSRNLPLQETKCDAPPVDVTEPAPREQPPGLRINWKLIAISGLGLALLAVVASILLIRAEYLWRSPIANARFQTLTDFDAVEQAAAVSRDGRFVAFLSDRDGSMDVWLTQLGSGEFHNMTHGSALELVNPSIRALGFAPDNSLVTFWVRRPGNDPNASISIWASPVLGGHPRPYLQGVAEFDWSQDGSRLAYHTPGPGDPTFVTDGSLRPSVPPIFTAPSGLHCHFPLWSPDSEFLYFVQGSLPDKLDIWRIPPSGGIPERITSHNSLVSHPVLLDRRTLLYLASDHDGSGPWLYSLDVERKIPHRLTSGLDRYTSLATSADGRRLVLTRATPKRTLWRFTPSDSPVDTTAATQIPLTTSTAFFPRLGPNYLLYVSSSGTSDSIWKVGDGVSTELWTGQDAHILGGPAVSKDGSQITFSARQRGQTLLYVAQADGTNARVIADSLDLQSGPAWSPDGQSIIAVASDHDTPILFRVALKDRSAAPFLREYAASPAWSPDGQFLVYSGPDIGTTFSVKAVTAHAEPHLLPSLTLTRGARRLAFTPGGHELLFLRGDIQHKNLWLLNLDTGAERQLTSFAAGFDIRDFDISPDGRQVVLERVQERSDVVLVDRPRS